LYLILFSSHFPHHCPTTKILLKSPGFQLLKFHWNGCSISNLLHAVEDTEWHCGIAYVLTLPTPRLRIVIVAPTSYIVLVICRRRTRWGRKPAVVEIITTSRPAPSTLWPLVGGFGAPWKRPDDYYLRQNKARTGCRNVRSALVGGGKMADGDGRIYYAYYSIVLLLALLISRL